MTVLTPICRLGVMLEMRRYCVAVQREDSVSGVVAFLDPHTLAPGWNGPLVFGRVCLRRRDLDWLRAHPDQVGPELERRIREAESELMRALG